MKCERCGLDDELFLVPPCIKGTPGGAPQCCAFVHQGERCIEPYLHRGPHTWAIRWNREVEAES